MSTRFNIFSAESIDAPDRVYSEIRRTSPVCQVDPDGWWAVSRHDDVVFVLKHPELFSSAGRSEARDAILDPRLAKDPIFAEEGSILTSDPPAHGRLRRLINGAFTPRAMQRREERVRHSITRRRCAACARIRR